MADDTPEVPPPEGDGIQIGTPDRVLAVVLLAGALALSYICLDVLAGGRLTRALSRGGRSE